MLGTTPLNGNNIIWGSLWVFGGSWGGLRGSFWAFLMAEKHIVTVTFVCSFFTLGRSPFGSVLSIHHWLCGSIAVDLLDTCIFYLGVVKVKIWPFSKCQKHIVTVTFVRSFLTLGRSPFGSELSIHHWLCGSIAVDLLDTCLFYLGAVKVKIWPFSKCQKHIVTVTFVRSFFTLGHSPFGSELSIHHTLRGSIAVDLLDTWLYYLGVVKVRFGQFHHWSNRTFEQPWTSSEK